MPTNDYLSEAYDQRPELIIHDRLRHSGSIQTMIEIAQKKNYNVSFDRGPFWKDVVIKDGQNSPSSHTIQSAIQYMIGGQKM